MSKSYQHFINGQQTVQGASGRVSDIFNPAWVRSADTSPSQHSCAERCGGSGLSSVARVVRHEPSETSEGAV